MLGNDITVKLYSKDNAVWKNHKKMFNRLNSINWVKPDGSHMQSQIQSNCHKNS